MMRSDQICCVKAGGSRLGVICSGQFGYVMAGKAVCVGMGCRWVRVRCVVAGMAIRVEF